MSTPEKKRYALKPAVHQRTTLIDYQGELNPAQWQAVRTTKGPQLVIAGAGTGKTRTLIYRVAYLIEQGIPPESILLMTFTKKSAEQMMRRAAAMLDGRCSQITGGTFHGFANSVLRRHATLLGYQNSFGIADRSDAEDIINLIRSELGFAKADKRFPKKRTLLSILSKSANTRLTIDEIVNEEYSQYTGEIPAILDIAQGFAAYKKRNNVLDYDDLLLELQRLLEEHPEVRKTLSQQHRYIMVDEFQDTNFVQAEIAHLLASEHENLMVVGDDAQSIYSFRGASFRNIMEFPKRYEHSTIQCTITTLEHNYRSTEPILQFSNSLMQPAQEKYEKALFSGISSAQKPVFLETSSFEEQAAFVAQHVLELREEGVSLNDIAVVFRSGWHSNELEFELAARNIPFVKYGGLKFVEAAHVKDLVAVLRVMHNINDVLAWHRLLLLIEGIGDKTAQNIITLLLTHGLEALSPDAIGKTRYAADLVLLYALLGQCSGSALSPADAAVHAARFYEPLLKKNYDDFKKRQNDIVSFTDLAHRYHTLSTFLDELSLHPPELSQMGSDATEQEKENLVLSTIHSAKGLEWHSVFVLCLIDGFVPSAQALKKESDIEEERRLLYVACTRAKHNLFLISPQLNRRSGNFPFSQGLTFSDRCRFLSQMEDFNEVCEQWVLTDGD